jgi:WD40 repeat protein
MLAVWEIATGRHLAEHHLGAVNAIGLSRDGGVMLAFEDAGPGAKARAWLLAGDLSRAIQLDHDAGLVDARFSRDGARLATLSYDGTARIWNRDGGLEAKLPHAGYVVAAAWSPDGSWLATGTSSGTLTIWDRSTWQIRKAIEAHGIYISALTIGDDGTLIASGAGDGIVKLWDAKLLVPVARIPTGTRVEHLALERDQLLVSGPFATQSWRCDRYEDTGTPLRPE